MSYRFTETLSSFFFSTLGVLSEHVLVTMLLVLAAAAWSRFDPRPAARTAQFAGLGLLVLMQLQVLTSIRGGTLERLDASRNSVYASVGDQAGGDTVQYAPMAAYRELSSRQQTLTLSDRSMAIYGLSALPGWDGAGMEPSDTILDVRDRVRESDHTTLVERTIDFQRYVALPLQKSLLDLRLDFVPDSVAYQAKFSARYQFKNPLKEKATLRFTFPLPADSGTLQDFRMKVNGKLADSTEWVGEVAPEGVTVVEVSYSNRGRRSWTYSPTKEREFIGELSLNLVSDNDRIKFRKDGLFPSRESSGRWDWTLKDVITSQDVSLFFPATPKKELVEKTLSFAPLGLLVFFLTLAFAVRPRAKTLSIGSLAYSGGVVLTSYLWTFFSFPVALFAGATLAALVGLWLVGRQGLWPTTLGWLTWMAFSWPGQTGLVLTLLGFALLIWWSCTSSSPAWWSRVVM